VEDINRRFPSKKQKDDWQWRAHYTTKRAKAGDDNTIEQIFTKLDELWKEMKSAEIKICNN